jgi:hypothetical protein
VPIPVVINGETFQYPEPNQLPGWGGQATDAFVALANVVNGVVGPYDILNTVSNIANNVTTPTLIPGLAFSPVVITGATVNYNVYRVTSTNEVVEQGLMLISYLPNSATWDIVTMSSQASNVVFSISPQGQVLYTDDNMPGSNYSGSITFRASALS